MATKTVQDSSLTAVANAIRAKTGKSATMEFPDEFVSEIGSISGGGGNEDFVDLVERTITTVDNSDITALGNDAFRSAPSLVSVKVPNVATIGNTCFYGCRQLKSFSARNMSSTIGSEAFRDARQLMVCDLGSATQIGQSSGFDWTIMLGALILRRTDAITALQNINIFSATHFTITGGMCHVYVPRSLISAYQSATNWSTLYAASSGLFRALEDYTTDGTTSGDLDMSKVYSTHTPVYEVSNKEFSGDVADTIDTGVKLFDTNGVFTIVFDVTNVSGPGLSYNRPMFECVDGSTGALTVGNGFRMWRNSNNLAGMSIFFNPAGNNTSGQGMANEAHFYGALICNGLDIGIYGWSTSGVGLEKNRITRTGTLQTHNKTLLIGGGRDANDNYVNGWYGTVHSCKVYKELVPPIDIYHMFGFDPEV